MSWRLICPPRNWSNPVAIGEAEVATLSIVANRLDLPLTIDKGAKKVYLGVDPPPPRMRLRYPSGYNPEIVSAAQAGEVYASSPGPAAPLIVADGGAQLSKHFALREFLPGRGQWEYARVSPALVQALEDIRSQAGGPVIITSGYRPPEYNRDVGGVSDSTHIDGLAADIYVGHLTTAQLLVICERVIGKRGGVGYYPDAGFVHVDVRGYYSRWSG